MSSGSNHSSHFGGMESCLTNPLAVTSARSLRIETKTELSKQVQNVQYAVIDASRSPFVGAPGPGPLIQGRRDREAAEAYLYEYLAYSNLTDDTEGIVKCNIYASHSNHLPAGVLKALRAFMEDKLRHELSSTTWSRMLEQYCLHVAPQQDEQLKECFMKALHDNHGMFQKLNCPKHLEKLEVDETYAPLLVSLLLELLSRLDW
ncbi:MAG: hypothetical protein L6R42_008679, partial [Xanthoria sp. 1 TBL-2021]